MSGPDHDPATPLLSVVICTYNRCELLPRSLDGLMDQTIRDQIQVIVVDDGSTGDTASVVADYEVDFVALNVNQGLSFARNEGLSRARASIIAFTDDDVIVPSDWCERLLDAWGDAPGDVRAIGGVVTVAAVHSFTQRYLTRHNPLSPIEIETVHAETFAQRFRAYLNEDSRSRDDVRPVYSLVGANMSFTREALREVGGFDPSIRFGGDEDHVCRILRSIFGDQSILCYPSITVAHNFDPRLSDTLRRAYLYGVSNGRTWVRDGGIPGLRPIGGLFTVSFLVALPLSLIGAAVVALLIPFTMWRRWVKDSWRERNPEVMAYPLVALLQELYSNVGFFAGWIQERRRHS